MRLGRATDTWADPRVERGRGDRTGPAQRGSEHRDRTELESPSREIDGGDHVPVFADAETHTTAGAIADTVSAKSTAICDAAVNRGDDPGRRWIGGDEPAPETGISVGPKGDVLEGESEICKRIMVNSLPPRQR